MSIESKKVEKQTNLTINKVTQDNSMNTNYLVVKNKFLLSLGHIVLDLDEIFLNILKIFLKELKFII